MELLKTLWASRVRSAGCGGTGCVGKLRPGRNEPQILFDDIAGERIIQMVTDWSVIESIMANYSLNKMLSGAQQ